jgi:hypothetical protein
MIGSLSNMAAMSERTARTDWLKTMSAPARRLDSDQFGPVWCRLGGIYFEWRAAMKQILEITICLSLCAWLAGGCSSSAVPASAVCEKMMGCDPDSEASLEECVALLEEYSSVLRKASWNAYANCLIGSSCELLMSGDGFTDCLQAAMAAAPASAGDGMLSAYCARAIECGQYPGSVADCLALLKEQAGDYLGTVGMFNDSLLGCLERCTAGLDCAELNNFYEICGLECELPWVEIDLDCDRGHQDGEVCVCDEGWAGAKCDTCAEGYTFDGWDCLGHCQPDTCNSHGICSDDYGNLYCSCDTGYQGERCEECAAGYLFVDGRCRPTAGCAADGAPCDDGLICTDNDRCGQGVCLGDELDCDDGLDCTSDGCMELVGGCFHEPVPTGGPEGNLGDPICSNGIDDDCDGLTDAADEDCLTLPCVQAGDCPDDGNPCTVASCQSGLCRWPALPEASACPGSDDCASQYICRGGQCLPGASDRDQDLDGFIDASCAFGTDCDDSDPTVHPAAEGPRGAASCADGLDNDCDGLTDVDDSSCWVQSCSQDGWCLERPRTGADNLTSLWALGSDDVWAAGGMEIFLHWDGTGWARVPSPSFWSVYDLCFCAPDDGWAVTQTGDILRYDGVDWQVFPSPNDPHILSAVWCQCDAQPAADVWAVGRPGKVVHYDGQAWSMVDVPPVADLYGAWAPGPGELWAVGRDGALLHYVDSLGQVIATGLGEDLNSVWGRAPGEAWAVGDGGTILHYDGLSWTDQSIPGAGSLSKVWGAPDGSGPWAVGGNWQSGSLLGWTGSAWRAEYLFGNPSPALAAIGGTAADDLWAVGAGGAISHWDGLQSVAQVEPVSNIEAVCAQERPDGRVQAWAVGSTADRTLEWNGADWRINRGAQDRAIVGIWCGLEFGTWVINQDGDYRAWGDSLAASGSAGDLPIAQYLNSLAGRVVDDQVELWAVGDNGLTAHMQQGHWSIDHASGGLADFLDVWIAPAPALVEVFAVGDDGLLATRDASGWTVHDPLVTENLNGVWGDGQGTVWVVGDRGAVLRYDGQAFVVETVPAEGDDLADVWGSGPDDVWIAGRQSMLHFDGNTWTSEAIEWGYNRKLAGTRAHVWTVDRNGSIWHKQR